VDKETFFLAKLISFRWQILLALRIAFLNRVKSGVSVEKRVELESFISTRTSVIRAEIKAISTPPYEKNSIDTKQAASDISPILAAPSNVLSPGFNIDPDPSATSVVGIAAVGSAPNKTQRLFVAEI
jgi:hypothetical protein